VLSTYGDLSKKISSYIDKVGKHARRRNAFVHAMWVHEHQDMLIVFDPSSPRLSNANVMKELQSIISDCESLVTEGMELHYLLEKELQMRSSQDKLAKELRSAHEQAAQHEATDDQQNRLNYLLDSLQSEEP
jgi:hypothetical protein